MPKDEKKDGISFCPLLFATRPLAYDSNECLRGRCAWWFGSDVNLCAVSVIGTMLVANLSERIQDNLSDKMISGDS